MMGGGKWTALCHRQIAAALQADSATPFLTTSCTAALEMSTLLLRLGPGDEVIMPSWTFASTANAVALHGATPVFVDVTEDTLNIDAAQVEEAITPRTRAVICVHYGGVPCDMDALGKVSADHGLTLIEDAAQAYGSRWNGRAAGTFGTFATFSFHGTKNISCGEGGALIVNLPETVGAAEIAWEKGTDRLRYHRQEVEWYDWADLGSSFLPSDLIAALLSSQLAMADTLNDARRAAWERYHALLAVEADKGRLRLSRIPGEADHNGHIYPIRLADAAARERVAAAMAKREIDVRAHYQPLHLAPAGRRYCRSHGDLRVSTAAGQDLLRLPIDSVITPQEQEHVVATLIAAIDALG